MHDYFSIHANSATTLPLGLHVILQLSLHLQQQNRLHVAMLQKLRITKIKHYAIIALSLLQNIRCT